MSEGHTPGERMVNDGLEQRPASILIAAHFNTQS